MEQTRCEDEASAINKKLQHSEQLLQLESGTLKAIGQLICAKADSASENCLEGFTCQITLQSYNQGVYFKDFRSEKRSSHDEVQQDFLKEQSQSDKLFLEYEAGRTFFGSPRYWVKGITIGFRDNPLACLGDHSLVGKLFPKMVIQGDPQDCETRGKKLYEIFQWIKYFDTFASNVHSNNKYLDESLAKFINRNVNAIEIGKPSDHHRGAYVKPFTKPGVVIFENYLNENFFITNVLEGLLHEVSHLQEFTYHRFCTHGRAKGKVACDGSHMDGGAYSVSLEYFNRIISGVYPSSKEVVDSALRRRDDILENFINKI